MASPTYVFRDDLEADKQRAADAAQANPIQTLAAPTPAPAPTAPAPMAPQPSPAAPSQPENPFEAFSKALEAQNPFKQQIKQSVQQTLANPGEAADAANTAARDRLARENNAAQEETRNQAITNYGGYQTGQARQALDKFRNSRLMNEQSFELDAAANKAGSVEQARSNAIGQGVAMVGQEEQSRLAEAQLAQNERMQGKQLASTEKLTYAGLDLEKKKFDASDANAKQGLSLEANAQALAKQGMDLDDAYKYASLSQAKMLAEKGLSLEESAQQLTRDGMSQQNAQYYAGLASQEKESAASRALQEKLTFAQIGSQEKMQATQQVYEAAQKDMDRSLEKLLSSDRIQAQFQLADLDRTFQEKMQASGFIQEKDLETMRADLQTKLQDRGISADVAKQIADQKFTELMAGRDQAYQAAQADIQRQWSTGERISTQTWDASMQASDQMHDEIMAKLSSTLRLDEAKNAQTFQTAFQEMQNTFTSMMAEVGFSREMAMQNATQAFQAEMQRNGYTHDEAMQASQLAAQSMENDRNRASQELMAAASMAQQDTHFMAELQQRYAFNDSDLQLRTIELSKNLELMGLQGEQLKNAIGDSKINTAMQIAAMGMEIGDGSTGAMAPFVAQLGTALETYFKANGVNVASGDIIKSLTPTPSDPGTPPKPAGTIGTVAQAQGLVDKYGTSFSAKIDPEALKGMIDQVAKGTLDTSDLIYPDENQEGLLELQKLPGWSTYLKNGVKSQVGSDYTLYAYLTHYGVPTATAYDIVSTAIGPDRFKTSYKAVTGKDWT
jgi:hypothetical protein